MEKSQGFSMFDHHFRVTLGPLKFLPKNVTQEVPSQLVAGRVWSFQFIGGQMEIAVHIFA